MFFSFVVKSAKKTVNVLGIWVAVLLA